MRSGCAKDDCGGSPELGKALLKRTRGRGRDRAMQLAYTLGEWKDDRAGQALGKLRLRDAGDRFLTRRPCRR